MRSGIPARRDSGILENSARLRTMPPKPQPELVKRRTVPAWVMSAVLHFTVFLTLSFVLRMSPRGAAVEPNRTGGIVLVQGTQGKPEYLAEGTPSSAGGAPSGSTAVGASSPLPSSEEAPVDLAGLLPSRSEKSGL